MRKKILIRLALLLMSASIGLALSSTATAQSSTNASAAISLRIQAVAECQTVAECRAAIDALNQQLDKTLDAFEAAKRRIAADADLESAHVALENLLREQVKAVQAIAAGWKAFAEDLQKQIHPSKSWLRKVFETAEKALIFAAGVALGGL